MNAGFATNPPGRSVSPMSRAKMDCVPFTSGRNAFIVNRASARHPVVPNFSINEKQERVTASSFFFSCRLFHCLIKTHGFFQQIFRVPSWRAMARLANTDALLSYIIILYLMETDHFLMGISMNSIPQWCLARVIYIAGHQPREEYPTTSIRFSHALGGESLVMIYQLFPPYWG